MDKRWLRPGFIFLLANCVPLADRGRPPTQAATAVPLEPVPTLPAAISQQTAPLPTTPASNWRVAQEPILVPKLIPFDGIAPVYDPKFATAAEAPLDDEELVMGVAWGGEAKAYPVTVLQFREMVDDELAGIPTLVTW